VALTYVSSARAAEEVVSTIKALPGSPNAIAVRADASDPATAATKIVTETVDTFGHIDIIINNAANGSDQTLKVVEPCIFNTMFHTNVLFPLLLVKESMPHLRRGGRIVNISSSGSRSRQCHIL
jgi:3-oxoacyl-[acyl-carrier protein] reductase